jgi:PAS domain S-box-containing protein
MERKIGILIVDDDVELALNLQDILKDKGYHVVVAHTGQTALSLCREGIFDLALVDVRLPDMPGSELINGLTVLSPLMEYILITGHASLESAVSAVKNKNIVSYELKPVDIDRFLSFLDQVVKRHRAEEQTRESKKRFSALTHNVPGIVFIKDFQGCYVYVNETIEMVCHLKKEDWLGKTDDEIFPGETAEQLKVNDRWVIENGRTLQVVETVLKDDGLHSWLINKFPIPAEDGTHFLLGGVGIDITERKHADEIIRQQNEFLNNIINSIPHLFYVIDAHDYKLHLANSAARAGRLAHEITCHAFVHNLSEPCGTPEHPCPVDEVKKSGKPAIVQYIRLKNGKPKVFEVHGFPVFDDNGNIAKVILYSMDVSEREKLVERLRQAQKIEAIGTLAGGIAHDFNNILSIILGYTELALGDAPRKSRMNENLLEVVKASLRARDLVKQILTFSRQNEHERNTMEIGPLIKEACKFMRASLPSTINIVQNIEGDVGLIEGDPIHIYQILVKLPAHRAGLLKTILIAAEIFLDHDDTQYIF